MTHFPLTSRLMAPCLLFSSLLIVSAPLVEGGGSPAGVLAGTAEVVDGDGLRLHGTAIRLHGIDARERDQLCRDAGGSTWPCGQAAADHLAGIIRGGPVACIEVDRDRYDRSVATCEAAGVDLGGAMVAEGLAWAYLRYSEAYAAAEASARQQGVGVWSGINQPPWEHRAAVRTRPVDTEVEAGECRIKGNISRSGARIYHLPGTRNYPDTRISEAKGERWFCSEEEARAAGWRPPRG